MWVHRELFKEDYFKSFLYYIEYLQIDTHDLQPSLCSRSTDIVIILFIFGCVFPGFWIRSFFSGNTLNDRDLLRTFSLNNQTPTDLSSSGAPWLLQPPSSQNDRFFSFFFRPIAVQYRWYAQLCWHWNHCVQINKILIE